MSQTLSKAAISNFQFNFQQFPTNKLRFKVHTLFSTDSVIYMPALVEMREGDKSLVPNQFQGAYD